MHIRLSSVLKNRPRIVLTGLLLCCIATVGAWRHLSAESELTGPSANDRQVTLVVSALMRNEHLSKHPLDDEISQRGLKTFLKGLDPMKVYFYQSDIDEFNANRHGLDDRVKQGRINFAYTVFNRFLKRIDERVALVRQMVNVNHDFTIDEEMVTEPKDLRYPTTAKEAAERWRQRIKYDLLVLKGDDVAGDEAKEKLIRRYESFAKRMNQTDSDELLEMYLTAITSSFDPHTTYMSPSALENFRILMRLNLEGIGAALQVKDGYTVVSKVIPGGAADKHGKLEPEDRIERVGQGTDGEMVDVVNMKLGDVVKLIRGRAGTVVRLGVKPGGTGEMKVYAITRAKIELKDSEARAEIIQEGRKPNGAAYKVGVIDLPSFYMDMEGARRGVVDYKSTTRDVRKILEDFNDKGVDAVMLDLRRNGGGSLTEAINLTGLFIDHGPVVQVKDSDGRIQQYDDTDRGLAWDGPLVVLTSKFSASASEILAGAIQDYRRGLVVGDSSTHGKGTVQSLLELGAQLFKIPNPPNLGALKITMQQFYRPNGDSTQKRGVLADVLLPSLTDHMDVAESDLDYPVDFDKIPAARYSPYKMVSQPLLADLRTRSMGRRSQSADFQKLLKNIDRYRQQKERDAVTLNEAKFLAEREELDADKEEEKQFEEQNDNDEVVKRTFYFNESLAVTVDYVELLGQDKVAVRNR